MRSVFKIYMMNRIANEAACLGYRMNWNRQRKGGAHLISVPNRKRRGVFV